MQDLRRIARESPDTLYVIPDIVLQGMLKQATTMYPAELLGEEWWKR